MLLGTSWGFLGPELGGNSPRATCFFRVQALGRLGCTEALVRPHGEAVSLLAGSSH